jgi:exopolyphosphatase/guanosine-5'-triphosphate,3'-diphosphate pyrophosphatase
VLDLGGGSMQLTRVEDRQLVDARSWPLGAVRMTDGFPWPDPRQAQEQAAQDAA